MQQLKPLTIQDKVSRYNHLIDENYISNGYLFLDVIAEENSLLKEVMSKDLPNSPYQYHYKSDWFLGNNIIGCPNFLIFSSEEIELLTANWVKSHLYLFTKEIAYLNSKPPFEIAVIANLPNGKYYLDNLLPKYRFDEIVQLEIKKLYGWLYDGDCYDTDDFWLTLTNWGLIGTALGFFIFRSK